jgi:hypothetical protein
MEIALLGKPPVMQIPNNFLTLYGTQRLIKVFTTVLHWSPSYVRSIDTIPFYLI